MVDSKLDTEILEILNLDLKIETNTFEKVTFRDENLEKLYQLNIDYNNNQIFLQGDRIIILGWLSILLYIYFAYFRVQIFITAVIFSLISIFLILMKNFKIIRNQNFVNNSQVMLITFYLNSKIIYLNYLNISLLENNEGEIVRTIVFDFISSNLLSLLVLEENISTKIFLLLLNLTSVFISKLLSNSGNCYLMDGLTSIFYSFIFYLLKKAWEYNLRSVFSERYCLSKLLNYSNDFIRQLNGIHFNRSISKTHISGKSMKDLIDESINNSGIFEERDVSLMKNETDLFISNNNNYYESFMKKLKSYKRNISDDQKNITLYEKLEEVQSNVRLINKFESIGIFYYDLTTNKKYYEVFYRKFYITEFNIIDDIFFYDVSNYVVAQQKIDEENLIKQKVYAKISHEFKTPINSIIGLIENIKESILNKNNEETIKNLNTIKSLSNYIIYLTNDIIQFSYSTNIKSVNIHTNIVNIKEIIEFSYEILICLLNCTSKKSQSITTVLKYDESINDVIVYSDEVRLKQILLNFISNAVKFTKSGSITICAERNYNPAEIVLKVIDTGIGIKQDDQKKLYNEFTQFYNKSINNSFGTGLGLSICKNLADSLNLKISTCSNYGVGSTFSLIIPPNSKPENGSGMFNSLAEKASDQSQKIRNFRDPIKILQRKESKIIKKKDRFLSVKTLINCNYIGRSKKNIKISKTSKQLINNNDQSSCFKSSGSSFDSMVKLNKESKISNQNVKDNYSNVSSDLQRDQKPTQKLPKINIIKTKESNDLFININSKNILSDELFNLEVSNSSSRNASLLIEIEQEPATVRREDDLCRFYNIDEINEKKYILTVDDNLFINQSVKSLIESIFKENNISNYEVICASDGIEMLHYLKEDQNQGNLIKCIITDENMEYMNGSHATKIIREYEKSGKIKPVNIITSTCQDDEITKNYLHQSGSQLILSKPLNKLDLVNAFKELKIL